MSKDDDSRSTISEPPKKYKYYAENFEQKGSESGFKRRDSFTSTISKGSAAASVDDIHRKKFLSRG